MKTTLLLIVFAFGIFSKQNLSAQTSVVLGSGYDYSSTVCPLPATMYTTISGYAVNYNDVTDNITMNVFWGDGSDTTVIVDLLNGGTTDSMATTYLSHNYLFAGTYAPLIIATGPDGNGDTLIGNAITYSGGCVLIDGYTYRDNNANCIYDGGDTPMPGEYMKIENSAGSLIYFGISDATGHYTFSVTSGLTGLKISPYPSSYTITTCPVSGSYTFNSTGPSSFDFGIDCASTSVDFYASHSGMCGVGAPGSAGKMSLVAGAGGCTVPTPATVTLTLDPLVSYTSMIYGPAPTTIVGNVLTWDITLSGYSGYGYGFNVSLNTLTSTSAIVGDISCWDIDISTGATDPNMLNNHEYHCLTYGGPWDPNAKEVVPAGIGPSGNVAPDTEFYYTLYFQNTGNAPAINIYVMDTISDNLDLGTFQITGSSHLMNPIFNNTNIVRFDFPNINLPDSTNNEPLSHGWVKYRIKAKSGLANGTQITNTGHIYFDYNSAIVTNTTLNTIDISLDLAENEISLTNNVLFPNPATNFATMRFEKNISGVLSLFDAMGKQVKSLEVNNSNEIQIPLQNLPAGFYGLSIPGVELEQNRLQVIK